MGFLRRLRAASSSSGKSDDKDPHLHRSTSANLLGVSGSSPPAAQRHSSALPRGPSSPTTPNSLPPPPRASKMPWKRDKRSTTELQAIPYEATAAGPRRAGAMSTSKPTPPIPTITTEGSPRTPRVSSTYDTSRGSTSPTTPTNTARHKREGSQATVISLASTFTGRSRRSSTSSEWQQEGGILGKFGFENNDKGAAEKGVISRPSNGPIVQSPPVQARARPLPTPQLASPTKPPLKSAMRKLPLVNLSPQISPDKSATRADKEEVEEIRTSEADDDRRGGWKGRILPRRSSRPSDVSVHDRPPSPTLPRRPHTQVGDKAPQLRRPSSSIFHNPFQRSQSRVSLAFDLESPPADDGSFQLKSFRHVSGVSGASDADGAFGQYYTPVDIGKPEKRGRAVEKPQRSVPPSSPSAAHALPRPRQPSAAGSVDSQKVSVAAFRRGIRRPSSTAVLDDEDDLPLNASRAQLRESTMRRDSSSALSMTDGSPLLPSAAALPTSSAEASRVASPLTRDASPLARGPSPPGRPNNAAPTAGLLLKGVQTTRSDDKGDARRSQLLDAPRSLRERQVSPTALPPPHRPAPRKISMPVVQPSPSTSLPPTPDSLDTVRSPNTSAVTPSKLPRRTTSLIRLRDESVSPAPPPLPIKVPEAQVVIDEFVEMRLPPRPHELPDGPIRTSRPPSRGMAISPSIAVLNDPLMRISGLWGSSPGDTPSGEEKEEAFDPSMVAASTYLSEERPRPPTNRTVSEGNRQSLYDRLSAATTAVSNTVVAAISPALDDSERLFIPPCDDPPHMADRLPSPTSERTLSPPPVPPTMPTAPAPPPSAPHSSFGRPERQRPGGPRNKAGWDSSSDEDEKTPPARRTLKTSTSSQSVPKAPAPGRGAPPRPRVVSQHSVEEMASESEDEPLQTVRQRASSRTSQRPSLDRSSRSDLRTAQVAAQPRPSTMMATSKSSWSLSSSPSPNASPDEDARPPVRPLSRPQERPASRARMPRAGSSDRLSTLPRPASTDRLRGIHEPSPHHAATMLIANDARQSASPASSQSGLTGDSSMQQPLTPRSQGDPSRRSWAEQSNAPPRRAAQSERPRPSTVADNFYAADMDMYQQHLLAKQQFERQWMEQARAQFEDYWERASSVSNAQTAPGTNVGFNQPTYGYSYNQPPQMPPHMAMGMSQMGQMPMGQMPPMYPPMGMPYYGYGYGQPQVAFPGMPMAPVAMGSMGMPMSTGGGMYGYGPGAQSVYGGEFGPPVAPGMQPNPPSQGSPRARRQSGLPDAGRPASVAHGAFGAGHPSAQRTPPRPDRRHASGVAMSEAGGPPSSWRAADETPRPKRHQNVS